MNTMNTKDMSTRRHLFCSHRRTVYWWTPHNQLPPPQQAQWTRASPSITLAPPWSPRQKSMDIQVTDSQLDVNYIFDLTVNYTVKVWTQYLIRKQIKMYNYSVCKQDVEVSLSFFSRKYSNHQFDSDNVICLYNLSWFLFNRKKPWRKWWFKWHCS